jgi:hypothetical protein
MVSWVIKVRMYNRLFIVLCVLLFLQLGCRRDEQPQSYTVPKEQPVATTAHTQAAQPTPDIPVNAAPIHWTLPEGWQQLPPDGIRLGNFAVPGKGGATAAVAITSFPGEVGTELDNVNRWRQQLGLAPVEEGGVTSDPVTVDSAEGKLFDISGSTARTVVALVHRNGASWFFKMTGDIGAVADAKADFMKFLKFVVFSDRGISQVAEAQTTAPPAATPQTDNGSHKWSVPSGWVETPPGAMLFKSFSIAGDSGASAAVTVSFFEGEVGGKLRNVNRWRGQIGLAEVTEDQLASVTENLETAGGEATLVDFEGAAQRLVAVIAPHGGNTWFYKLLGDKAVVAKEKDSFVKFVKTVQYP